uniref:CCHC-type domain-containing protein n=1 Tax=Parascaris univalens TaxID=6257 RepID=A0A915A1U6_PARUN
MLGSAFSPITQVLSGILDDFLREENMCKVVLVDYGQTVLCSANIVFYFSSQSTEAREAPVALFTCRIGELTSHGISGYNTIEVSGRIISEPAHYMFMFFASVNLSMAIWRLRIFPCVLNVRISKLFWHSQLRSNRNYEIFGFQRVRESHRNWYNFGLEA